MKSLYERRPRIHGNGFVQLDLTPEMRLHIWNHPDIPKQKTPTPVHDHMFSFTSRILLGSMINKRYEALTEKDTSVFKPTHKIYTAKVREGEDTILVPSSAPVVELIDVGHRLYGCGQTYSMEVGDLHESITEELTATIIVKTGRTLSQGGPSPRVFVPIGMEPDNDFNRYQMLPEDAIWWIIADTLWKARHVDPKQLLMICQVCNRSAIDCLC